MHHTSPSDTLPHHRLEVWRLAVDLGVLVEQLHIGNARSRSTARESAQSVVENIAEAAGRTSRADKQRVYGIARGELGEAVSAIEYAGAIGACNAADVAQVVALGSRIAAMLWRLCH